MLALDPHLMFGFGALSAPLLIDWSLSQTDGIRAGLIPAAVFGVALGLLIFFGPQAPAPRGEEDGGWGPTPTISQLAVVALFFFIYVGAEARLPAGPVPPLPSGK